MDVLEKFLRKVSYKFSKGYPDINDAQDMLMLEGMLKEIGIDLNELTVSPVYQTRGVPNPFYTVTPEMDSKIRDILNKKNIPFKNVIYKAVEDVKEEPLISIGKSAFELFDDTDTSLNVFIKIPKNKVAAHYGVKSRKDSTASSNVNEFLSLYFLLHPQFTTVDDLEEKEGGTGVLRGNGEEVTYTELIELINKDETPEKDIKIGFNNAQALKKDLKEKSIAAYYWTPRQKPANINPSNPSDIILQLENGNFIGYSNKITEGADKTPKFNTSITAFFSKIGGKEEDIKSMIDKAWEDATIKVPSSSTTAKKAINGFNIRAEDFSETKSRKVFADLALQFKEDNLNFFGKDFYHIFRNNLISSLINYLKTPSNLKYFLNTIAVYTYGQKIENETPCPYKLLIGSTSSSTIKEVSDNSLLKNVVTVDSTDDIKQIDFSWNGSTQTFDIKYNQLMGTKLYPIVIPVTLRTRSAPHWAGKSLYITSPGVEIS
jgi:hypothetical protein